MRIGVPTEVKSQESRVAITQAGVHHLAQRGHDVLIQAGAGVNSGISDGEYAAAGATILPTAGDVWGSSELLIKVKEPIASEYQFLRPDLVLFTYLHLAADKPQTEALVNSGTTSIAYETVQTADGALPLLRPMSEVAGRLAALVGTEALMKHHGGEGILIPGVPGVAPAKVLVIGAGNAGQNATQMAVGLRANVTVFDVNTSRLVAVDTEFGGRVTTMMSTAWAIEQAVRDADLVIGTVLVPGARAPKVVTNAMVASAKPGSVFVNVAVTRAGASKTPTPPRTPTRLSRFTRATSTAWRTCPARSRSPRPTPSPTPRCPTSPSWPTWGGATPCAAIPRWPRGCPPPAEC